MFKRRNQAGSMYQPRYQTRSKGQSLKRTLATVVLHSTPFTPTPETASPKSISAGEAIQLPSEVLHEVKTNTQYQDSYGVQPDETSLDGQEVEVKTNRLFALPPELQTMIYEFAVIEPEPVQLTLWSLKRPDKAKEWHLTTASRSWHRNRGVRPRLLGVCKYLRSFVAPIYFSGNTFATRAMHDSEPLRRMWGENSKYIRKISNTIVVSIILRDHPAVHAGYTVSQSMSVDTKMELYPDGTLVIDHRCGGTHNSDTLPAGQLCRCVLEAVAATSSFTGKDSRRMFEIVEHCAFGDEVIVEHKTCDRCSLPCLAQVW